MVLAGLVKKIMPSKVSAEDAEGMQFGTIPYQIVDGEVAFLMITSRRSANWVFPKGSVIKGQSPSETAAQETFEEAGVRGEIAEKPIGGYVHPSNSDPTSMDRVQLFPMLVTEQLEDWPEEAQRFRHWALLPQVKRLMASAQAAKLAADLNRRLVS